MITTCGKNGSNGYSRRNAMMDNREITCQSESVFSSVMIERSRVKCGPLSHLARKDLKTACVTLQRELPSIHYLALISHGPQTQSKTIAGFHVILTSQRQVLIQLYINRFPSHKHVHSKV
eukprot:GEMP01098223.1.p1 GENE.GEMP01098223.1~~GEMP01098223.1.p1  ORF type:complete len:120 (+),score=6.55 GEMP01098223.1:294-653(+)